MPTSMKVVFMDGTSLIVEVPGVGGAVDFMDALSELGDPKKRAAVFTISRVKPAHDCGPLCPEHGDDRDTSIDRTASS